MLSFHMVDATYPRPSVHHRTLCRAAYDSSCACHAYPRPVGERVRVNSGLRSPCPSVPEDPKNSLTPHCVRIRNLPAFRRCDVRTFRAKSFKMRSCGQTLVLPVFSRNRQPSSLLESTLMSILVSVDSKWFTVTLTPLESALTKNTRGRVRYFQRILTSLLPQSCDSHCSRTPLVQQ